MNAPQLLWAQRLTADEELPPSVRHVGVVLALYLRHDLRGAVGRKLLASLTGYNPQTVKAAVRRLRAAGWLHVESYGHKGRVNEYLAVMPGLFPLSPVTAKGGVELSTGGVVGTPYAPSGGAAHTPNRLVDLTNGGVSDTPYEPTGGAVNTPYASIGGVVHTPLLEVGEVGEVRNVSAAGSVGVVDEDEVERTVEQLPPALRPTGLAEVLRMGELVRQRMELGWSRTQVLEAVDDGLRPGPIANRCGLFTKLVPLVAAPQPKAQHVVPWCGACDEATRRPLDEQGFPDFTQSRCRECAQLQFAVAMA